MVFWTFFRLTNFRRLGGHSEGNATTKKLALTPAKTAAAQHASERANYKHASLTHRRACNDLFPMEPHGTWRGILRLVSKGHAIRRRGGEMCGAILDEPLTEQKNHSFHACFWRMEKVSSYNRYREFHRLPSPRLE